jgi:hypothetical protein
MKLGMTVAISLVAFISRSAQAQPTPPVQTWQKPCEEDVKKLCKSAGTDTTVPECLAAHEKDLSEACTSAFLWRYKVTQDCKDEIAACKDKVVAGTTLGQCLKDNDKTLSDKCRTALVRGSKRSRVEEGKAPESGKPDPAAARKGVKKGKKKPPPS